MVNNFKVANLKLTTKDQLIKVDLQMALDAEDANRLENEKSVST